MVSFPRSILNQARAFSALLLIACNTSESDLAISTRDWPQWLGPERTGKSVESAILKSWPPAGPREMWRAEVGGGYAGLAISQGKLYTMVCDSTDEYVLCLDAASGKALWQVHSDSVYVNPFGNGNGPRSTPTVDGNRVFALGAHGTLSALDKATGSLVWRLQLKTAFHSLGPAADGAYAGSPLVEGNLLLVEAGGANGNSFVALDKRDGQIVWTAGSDSAAFASPVAITLAGERQVVFFSASGVRGLAIADGTPRWHVAWKTPYDINANTPIFIPPDSMLISSINDMGSALIKLEKTVSGFDVHEIWRSNKVLNSYSTPILHRGYLYGFQNTFLSCVELATGEERWRQRGFSYGSLIYADGHLIVLGEKGKLALVEATPQAYREKASAILLGSRCYTPPALARGRLYLRDETTILCLDLTAEFP